jgi:hypothetical protein
LIRTGKPFGLSSSGVSAAESCELRISDWAAWRPPLFILGGIQIVNGGMKLAGPVRVLRQTMRSLRPRASEWKSIDVMLIGWVL